MDCEHEFREMTGGRVCEKCGCYQRRKYVGDDVKRPEKWTFEDTNIKFRPRRPPVEKT